MAISLDKILTISAEDWCKSNGVNLWGYDLVGVTSRGEIFSNYFITDSPKKRLAKETPANAMIVTGYNLSLILKNSETILYEANATALIPKDSKAVTNIKTFGKKD
jgi:hypothetical protein